jgi:SAM-dependent methyltransferase
MMFGYGDEFIYFECPNCGCLQISQIPEDILKYYPSTYYSLFDIEKVTLLNLLKDQILNALFFATTSSKHQIQSLPLFFPGHGDQIGTFSAFQKVHIKKNSRILDVGCGSGKMLCFLKTLGFKNLLGCDPNIDKSICYGNDLRILKETIDHIDGKWDLIMFNQSFEHISNQLETLQSVNLLLSENGKCLINMPTTSSFAWRHYKSNWVQLDAPRHLYIHSLKSIKVLAKRAKLDLKEVVFNSSALQFWGSEQYIKGIPLRSKESYNEKPINSILYRRQIGRFAKRAFELNLIERGDNAAFYLNRIEN